MIISEVKTGILKSSAGIKWNIQVDNGVGGRFVVPNSSNGYHGLLKVWWDHYCMHKQKWLLVTENNNVKKVFEDNYPDKVFYTVDLYDDFNNSIDYKLDICNEQECNNLPKLDVVICQATLEHIYNPFQAVKNMTDSLNEDGYLLLHTHTPGYAYHQYPRDYFRFFSDWFEDLENLLPELTLKELVATKCNHIFAIYNKEKI